MKELGVSAKVIEIVDQIHFSFLCRQLDGDDMNLKISHYSDARVDPYGVVSYDERMDEAKKRYKSRNISIGGVGEEKRKELVACGQEIEKQIFAKCKIKPEDINNQTVAPLISSLRNFVIK